MRKRVKAVILFVGAALTLFAANAFYLNNHNPFLEVEQQKINTSQVSPQKLFDTTWQTIKNEYYKEKAEFSREFSLSMYAVVHYASPFGVPNGAIVRSCSSGNSILPKDCS